LELPAADRAMELASSHLLEEDASFSAIASSN
jgi:hypothetical protein